MLKRKSGGATLVEFQIVTLFALLPLVLGLVQITLLLVARQTLDYATFCAARAGAVSHADASRIRSALATALLPLHAATFEEITGRNVVAVVGRAYASSLADVLLQARIEILGPSAAAFSDFAQVEDGRRLLHNDSLEHRATAKGASSGQSIQEANVLSLRVTYCQRLIVPFADRLLLGVLSTIDRSADGQRCYLQDRVPLVSATQVNMQSDAYAP